MDVRRTLLVCTVVALLLFAGCMGALIPEEESETEPEPESLEAAELVEKSQSAKSSISPFEGTMTMTITDGEDRTEVTYDVWMRPPGEVRMETVDGDETAGQPSVMVVNGSTTWMYNEGENRAVRMDGVSDPASLAGIGEELASSYGEMDAERVGNDTVAGRSVTVVEVTTNASSEFIPETMTLWIDDETYYPLKYEFAVAGYSDVRMTVTFEEFDPDTDISDDRFAFDPPADARVLEYDDLPNWNHPSVESLDAAVPFDVPDPDVPDEFAFVGGNSGENLAGWWGSFTYQNDAGDSLTVTVSEGADETALGIGGETIEIADEEATLTTTEVMNVSSTSIAWTNDDLTYRVRGTADEETLRAVAESIVE